MQPTTQASMQPCTLAEQQWGHALQLCNACWIDKHKQSECTLPPCKQPVARCLFGFDTNPPHRIASHHRAATAAAKKEPDAPMLTTAQAEFQRYSRSLYASEKGRRVMKTMDGVALPHDCRDSDFLRANAVSAAPSRIPRPQVHITHHT